MQSIGTRGRAALHGVCAVAGLAVFALPLSGQRPGRQGEPPRERPSETNGVWQFLAAKYDVDKNGTITRAEYGRDDSHWKELDENGDGVLDQAEVDGRVRPRWDPRLGAGGPKVGESAPDFALEILPPGFKGKGRSAGEPKPGERKGTQPRRGDRAGGDGKRPGAGRGGGEEGTGAASGAAEDDGARQPALFKLSAFLDKKSVVLIFGSFT